MKKLKIVSVVGTRPEIIRLYGNLAFRAIPLLTIETMRTLHREKQRSQNEHKRGNDTDN